MTDEVKSVAPDDEARVAANIMVDKNGQPRAGRRRRRRLIGIVTRHDIIRMMGL